MSAQTAASPGVDFEFVVAVAQNDAIGRGNRLPWHLRGDLQHFKALTLNRTVLMGRKTFASIGRALPNRVNLVLSRDAGFSAPGCIVVSDLDAVAAAAGGRVRDAGGAVGGEVGAGAGGVVMVIGGAEVYELCLARARRIHLTLVHTVVADADAFFAAWRGPEWIETARVEHHADADNDFDFSLLTLERSRG